MLKDIKEMTKSKSKTIFLKILNAEIWDISYKLWNNRLTKQHLLYSNSV